MLSKRVLWSPEARVRLSFVWRKLDWRGMVRADLTCSSCGYNLRGLMFDSLCPECGKSVTETLRTRPIRQANTLFWWKLLIWIGVALFLLLVLSLVAYTNQDGTSV